MRARPEVPRNLNFEVFGTTGLYQLVHIRQTEIGCFPRGRISPANVLNGTDSEKPEGTQVKDFEGFGTSGLYRRGIPVTNPVNWKVGTLAKDLSQYIKYTRGITPLLSPVPFTQGTFPLSASSSRLFSFTHLTFDPLLPFSSRNVQKII